MNAQSFVLGQGAGPTETALHCSWCGENIQRDLLARRVEVDNWDMELHKRVVYCFVFCSDQCMEDWENGQHFFPDEDADSEDSGADADAEEVYDPDYEPPSQENSED